MSMKLIAENLERIAGLVKIAYFTGHFPFGSERVFVKKPTRNACYTMFVVKSGADQYTVLSVKKNDIFSSLVIAGAKKEFSIPKEFVRVLHEMAQRHGIEKYYKTFSASDFITHMLNDEGILSATLYEWFPDLQEKEAEHQQKIGNFTVICGNNVSEDEMKNVEQLIQKASQLLSSIGFEDMLYGKIYVLASMGSKLATYSASDDTIRMSNKARKSPTAVKTLVHEIGHRIYYKKLGRNAKITINKKFDDEVHFAKSDVHIGDEFEDGKGVKYKVITRKPTSLYSTNLYWVMERSDKPGKQWQVKNNYFVGLKKRKDEDDSSQWVPSQYSKKNAEEWFSELLGYGLVDNNETWVTFIKSLV